MYMTFIYYLKCPNCTAEQYRQLSTDRNVEYSIVSIIIVIIIKTNLCLAFIRLGPGRAQHLSNFAFKVVLICQGVSLYLQNLEFSLIVLRILGTKRSVH